MAAANVSYPGVLPPPPGQTANLNTPETLARGIIQAAIICPVFALIFCGLRLYTARHIVRRIYWDDVFIILALLFAAGYSAVQIVETKYGSGLHMWDVTPEQFKMFILLSTPAAICYNFGTLCIKASIICFYLRFAVANRPFRVFSFCLLFVVAGYTIASAFTFLYLCQPMQKYYDASIPGTCLDMYSQYLVAACLNSMTDVTLLVMPFWLLYPLRVSFQQKVAVGLVLMPGGFVCGVSFVRLAEIPLNKTETDISYEYSTNIVWCLIEMYIGIICASLPILKPFMKYHFPGVFAAADQPRHEQVYVSAVPSRPTGLPRSWATTQTDSDASESGLQLKTKTGTGTQMTMSSTREMYNGTRPSSDDAGMESRRRP